MTAISELEQWKAVVLPSTTIADWTPSTARVGLAELRRLRHQLDAAQACLVGVLAQETGRDTRATLRRDYGMSAAEATKASIVAAVAQALPGAEAALACGRVSAEHLRLLHPVLGTEGVGGLLEDLLWSGESPDDFGRRVERWRIEREGSSRQARQRAARGVWFSDTEHGGISMRAVVGRVDGERIRAILNEVTDRAWKAAHPERAATLGGHGGEPRERRMADALVGVFDGAVVDRAVVDRAVVDREVDNDADAGDRAGHEREGSSAASRSSGPDAAPTAGGNDAPTAAPPNAGPPEGSSPRARSAGLPTLPRVGSGGAARTAVIITVDAETMAAELLGSGPISNDELLDVLAGPRTDVYAAVRDVRGAILKFGRSRRLASPLQRLALAVRDRGCIWTGCAVRWDRCDADHEPPWERGGQTDLDQLRLLCTNEHHPHRHDTGCNASFVNGEWTVSGPALRATAEVGIGAPP